MQRQKHRNTPSMKITKHKEQIATNTHVYHPTKGWRKNTVVDILGFQNKLIKLINTL